MQRMILMVALAISSLALAPRPALAQARDSAAAGLRGMNQWIQVASGTNVRISVSLMRMRTLSSGITRLWVRWDYPTGETFSGKRVFRTLRNTEIDCATEQVRTLSFVDYDRSGNVVASQTISAAEWLAVVPDSIGEELAREVCSFLDQ